MLLRYGVGDTYMHIYAQRMSKKVDVLANTNQCVVVGNRIMAALSCIRVCSSFSATRVLFNSDLPEASEMQMMCVPFLFFQVTKLVLFMFSFFIVFVFRCSFFIDILFFVLVPSHWLCQWC